MPNTKRYYLTRKRLVRIVGTDPQGKAILRVINEGEDFVPTDEELKKFGDRMAPVYTAVRAEAPIQEPVVTSEAKPRPEVEVPSEPKASETPSIFDQVNALSVNEVMRAVEEGRFPAEVALAAEEQGKKRKSLIAQLESMIETGI